MEQWHSVTVIAKCGGTLVQFHIDRDSGRVAQFHSDSKIWWDSGTVVHCNSDSIESGGTVRQSVTVIAKCGGAVAQFHSDRKIWWDSGTVVHCNSDSIESGGTVK